MKLGLQFAMPSELRALPGVKETEPLETVSGIPFFEVAPGILACAGGIGKVDNFIGDFLDFGRYAAFEIHIVAFSAFH